MPAYRVVLKRSAVKELAAIPKVHLHRIIKRIESLRDDPRPPGAEKLSGLDRYRIRQGDYRVVYSIQDDDLIVWVVKIGHRQAVYRRLK